MPTVLRFLLFFLQDLTNTFIEKEKYSEAATRLSCCFHKTTGVFRLRRHLFKFYLMNRLLLSLQGTVVQFVFQKVHLCLQLFSLKAVIQLFGWQISCSRCVLRPGKSRWISFLAFLKKLLRLFKLPTGKKFSINKICQLCQMILIIWIYLFGLFFVCVYLSLFICLRNMHWGIVGWTAYGFMSKCTDSLFTLLIQISEVWYRPRLIRYRKTVLDWIEF